MGLSETTSRNLLQSLGAGQSIAAVCEAAGFSRRQFDEWWQAECRRRVPRNMGKVTTRVRRSARIDFDRWGVPHIDAADDGDLMFALGYAVARDRLFQIDYLRRKAAGRIAEVLGREGLASDILYRTLGLAQIAEAEWQALPAESRDLLQAYCDGINGWIDSPQSPLPIEFDLLDYQPERWQPQDSLAILSEFRWYLTGRLPVIVIPELIKRRLGDGALYRATLVGEADEESILQPGDYTPSGRRTCSLPSGDGGVVAPGSNNWVLSSQRSSTGYPLMAGDPHFIFSALPMWFEVRLKGGTFDVIGVTLAGVPGVMIGRTPRLAWTITNNICSQRDLFQEQMRPGEPPSFLYDGQWEPAAQRREVIEVKGGESVEKIVQLSRNGPIVDELLPPAARDTGPVSLRWVGQQPCGWLTALFGMNRATSVGAFCESTRTWICPTWNVLCADVDGHIGLQTTGRIPLRPVFERGYRPGWDPWRQWAGHTAFDDMPRVVDPPRGFIVTANNRLTPDDYPVPLGCTATSGHRARRIRQEIERQGKLSPEDCRRLQQDVLSLRAAECVPALLQTLHDVCGAASDDQRLRQAVACLQAWDYQITATSVPAAVFNVFYRQWCLEVAKERLAADGELDRTNSAMATLAADRLAGLATTLLSADPHGWFHRRSRIETIVRSFNAALRELSQRLGAGMENWQWGRLHSLLQPHCLSGRGELGQLLDLSGMPLSGDGTTVCSASPNSTMMAYLGAGYRSVADLGDPNAGLWTIDSASASAQPGSPHYRDQLEPWSRGKYRYSSLNSEVTATAVVATLQLVPSKEGR